MNDNRFTPLILNSNEITLQAKNGISSPIYPTGNNGPMNQVKGKQTNNSILGPTLGQVTLDSSNVPSWDPDQSGNGGPTTSTLSVPTGRV